MQLHLVTRDIAVTRVLPLTKLANLLEKWPAWATRLVIVSIGQRVALDQHQDERDFQPVSKTSAPTAVLVPQLS